MQFRRASIGSRLLNLDQPMRSRHYVCGVCLCRAPPQLAAAPASLCSVGGITSARSQSCTVWCSGPESRSCCSHVLGTPKHGHISWEHAPVASTPSPLCSVAICLTVSPQSGCSPSLLSSVLRMISGEFKRP